MELGVDGMTRCGYRPSQTPVITPSLDGLFPFARIGAPFSAPGMRQDREFQLTDNLVWFKGKHTVRAGGDVRWLHNVFNNGGYSRGMVVSGDVGEFTSDSETCVTCLARIGVHRAFVRVFAATAKSLQHYVSLLRHRWLRPGHLAREAKSHHQCRIALRIFLSSE